MEVALDDLFGKCHNDLVVTKDLECARIIKTPSLLAGDNNRVYVIKIDFLHGVTHGSHLTKVLKT